MKEQPEAKQKEKKKETNGKTKNVTNALTLARLGDKGEIRERGPRIVADDGDALRVATERRYVISNPLQSENDVH